MMHDTGLSVDILALLKKTFKKYECIEQVKLYGSRAKGTFNERSDIDLIVYGRNIDRFLITQVLMDLDDSNIPYMMDVQNFHDLKNRRLIEHIDRVGRVIYSKDEELDKVVDKV